MSQTSRELVRRCLKFETPERVPRQLWALPWVDERYPKEMKEIRARFPADITGPGVDVYRPSPRLKGNPCDEGVYIDEWGCVFTNIQRGVVGEVHEAQIAELADWQKVAPPCETLPENLAAARDLVNRACAGTDKFVSCGCCPRPWERYQFLRTTANAMCDLMDGGPEVRGLIRKVHEFYLEELEFWAGTDVDTLNFMDDWGAQKQLLIPPPVWRELFKPLYKDYCNLAHASGKFVFMHSDGFITEIYPDLIEIGVDALNSQLFCMDMAELAKIAKGRITFWGEIDRQHVLTSPDPKAGRDAVRKVAKHLYDPRGGVIAQFELGPGSNPAVGMAIFDEWDKLPRR